MDMLAEQAEALAFYGGCYRVIFDRPLRTGRPMKLFDSAPDSERICRFCGLGTPKVTFRSTAHAVPEFLGNKVLISMNECDSCNHFFAKEYEDDLAKWFGPMRAVSRMQGKKGVPKYKTNDVFIQNGIKGLEIGIVDENLESSLKTDGPFSFKVPVPTPTQSFVPLNAAKALVKIACSLCPLAFLSECKPAIEWLLGRQSPRISNFPIYFGFTPGPNPYGDGRVLLLQRRDEKSLPLIWCIIGTANYRFQFFVPLCPSDAWMHTGKPVTLSVPHFPDVFGDKWKYGNTSFSLLDWAACVPTVENRSFSFHINKVVQVPINNESPKV
jgi:hypothetical protein